MFNKLLKGWAKDGVDMNLSSYPFFSAGIHASIESLHSRVQLLSGELLSLLLTSRSPYLFIHLPNKSLLSMYYVLATVHGV